MIVQFTVSNYKSIKDELTLDFQASSIKEHSDSLLSFDDEDKLLPVTVIYGPNGGGKSNVLEALNILIEKVRFPIASTLSLNSGNNSDMRFLAPPAIKPYAFSEESKANPTKFELFFRTEIAEYRYVLQILKNKISYESFSRIKHKTNRISSLFERKGEEIKLGSEFSKFKHLDDISDELPLLSFIGYSYRANEVVRDYVSWFLTKFNYSDLGLPLNEMTIMNIINYEPVTKLFKQALQEMDIDIEDIRFSQQESAIYTKHTINGNSTELSLAEESNGTKKIFVVLPIILYCLITGVTLVIDELDAKLHPLLLKYIIGLFTNHNINKNNAQLIFTSCDLSTMNNEVFRRDEIWFAAKGNEQNTQLYSLIEFKDENGNTVRPER